MFTGKFKFVYLLIKVVISMVIKEQKRIDLFEDQSRDNYDDRSFSRIDRSDINDRSIRNVLVFANRVTYFLKHIHRDLCDIRINKWSVFPEAATYSVKSNLAPFLEKNLSGVCLAIKFRLFNIFHCLLLLKSSK